MIVNIHGLGSNGANSKYEWLAANIPEHDIYSPTFDYMHEKPQQVLNHLCHKITFALKQHPKAAPRVYSPFCHSYSIHHLHEAKRELEENRGNIYVVGSSLGGFYARCLNLIFPYVTAILINPSLAPFLNLRLKHDVSKNICHGYIKLLEKYYGFDEEGKENLNIIIGDDDEVIDHKNITKALIPQYGFDNVHTVKGSHALKITEEVSDILKSIIKPPKIKEGGSRKVSKLGDIRLP